MVNDAHKDHEIIVTLATSVGLSATFRCNAGDTDPCRMRCPQHCEHDCEHDKTPGHECVYLPWLDEPTGIYEGPDVPGFVSGPVEFAWDGEWYVWHYREGWFEQ